MLARSMNIMAEQLDQRIQTIVRQENEHEAVLSSMEEGVLAVDEAGHDSQPERDVCPDPGPGRRSGARPAGPRGDPQGRPLAVHRGGAGQPSAGRTEHRGHAPTRTAGSTPTVRPARRAATGRSAH